MIDLLSPQGLADLAEAARRKLVIAFGLEGTLVPLSSNSAATTVPEDTRELLRVLSGLCPCAAISRPTRGDVLTRLEIPSLAVLVGSEGGDRRGAGPARILRARVSAWATALRSATSGADSDVEDRGFSVVIHFGRASSPEEARSKVRALAGALPGARLVAGRTTLHVLPERPPTRRQAVTALAARFPDRPLAFVGDAWMDADMFGAREIALPIRVGAVASEESGYFVRDQGRIDALLREIIQAMATAEAGSGTERLGFRSED